MGVATRPKAWQETIRHINQGTHRRLPITHGWYMRGRNLPDGGWEPEAGLPEDVLVYLDMGDPYVREQYPADGFLALSEVPSKRGIANITADFRIEPPQFEKLDQAMGLLRGRRALALAEIEEEAAVETQKLKDGGLPKGEGPQLRKKLKGLEKRARRIKDDASYATAPIYEAMVRERQAVVRSQMDPKALQLAELEKEDRGWEEHLATLAAGGLSGRPSEASTSGSATPPRSTHRRAASGDGSSSG